LLDGGFGFFHFADGLGEVVLGELFGGFLSSLLGLLEGFLVGLLTLRLLAFGLLALLFLGFAECLGDVFLLLLKLLEETGGFLQVLESFVQEFLRFLGGFLGVGQLLGIRALLLAEFLGEFVNLLVDGLPGFLEVVKSLTLRLAGALGVGLFELLLRFLHFAFGLLKRLLGVLWCLGFLGIGLCFTGVLREFALLLGLFG